MLQVVPSIAPDAGPTRSVQMQAAAARIRGFHVRVAARGAKGPDARELRQLPFAFELPTPSSVRALASEIDAADIVEIHSVWNGTTSVASALCRRAGVPYVLTPHGMLDPMCLSYRRGLKRLYRSAVEHRTLCGASGFHFLSEEERDRAVIGRTVRANEVVVAPNAALPMSGPISTGALQLLVPNPAGRNVLLFLGRLHPIKGIDLQLHALALVRQADRPLLAVVGPDCGDGQRLRRLASSLGIEPWVFWAGPVYSDERYALLAEADLVLLTSVYDANPIVAAETFVAGGALLSVAGCGGVDAAARAGAAIVVPRTAQDLAAGIRGLLNDPVRLGQLREQGRTYAADALAPAKVNEPLLRLYERIVHRVAPVNAA